MLRALAAGLALVATACTTASTAATDTALSNTVAEITPPPTTSPPTTSPPTTSPPTAASPTTTTPAATTQVVPPTAAAPPATIAAPPATIAPAPDVDAAAFAVYDATAGRWLAERDADTPRAVGSVMKLLTAYVVMQAGEPERVVTIPSLQLDPAESAIGVYPGERLQRDTLLRAMLIVSANDAARALAIDVAGSEEQFAARMNAAASELGLTGTVAVNPVGLDAPGAQSTARDVARLASVLLEDATFRETVLRRDARLHGQTFPTTNDLLATYAGATGVKSGRTTEAGWCLVGSAERDGRQLVVAVLGASSDPARLTSTTALLDWAFAQP